MFFWGSELNCDLSFFYVRGLHVCRSNQASRGPCSCCYDEKHLDIIMIYFFGFWMFFLIKLYFWYFLFKWFWTILDCDVHPRGLNIFLYLISIISIFFLKFVFYSCSFDFSSILMIVFCLFFLPVLYCFEYLAILHAL